MYDHTQYCTFRGPVGSSGGDQQAACYRGDEHLDQTDGLSCTHSRGKTSECGDHEESLPGSEVINDFPRMDQQQFYYSLHL